MPPIERVEKPWGHELIWAVTERYAAKILVIAPGCSLSLQYHEKKEETIYVNSGRVLVTYVDTDKSTSPVEVVLGMGQTFHVPPRMPHRFTALDRMVELFEVSTPELDDVVRLKDDYGRA
mgnify:CR=1 FL=1